MMCTPINAIQNLENKELVKPIIKFVNKVSVFQFQDKEKSNIKFKQKVGARPRCFSQQNCYILIIESSFL